MGEAPLYCTKSRPVPGKGGCAMTANAFTKDIKQYLDAGMNDHVTKPIDFGAPASFIAKYLRTRYFWCGS